VLAEIDATDYNTQWVNASAGGGVTQQQSILNALIFG